MLRILALGLAAGCSFRTGHVASDDAHGVIDAAQGVGDAPDATIAGNDALDACRMHLLPPAVNVDPATWSTSFLSAPAWNCTAAGTTTINTMLGAVTSTSCNLGTPQITNNVAQTSSGPNVLVVRLTGLTVSGGHALVVVGDKPVVFLVAGDVSIDSGGLVDASANHGTPGPGGSDATVCFDRGHGRGDPANGSGWGGGGGGFGTNGGQGGYSTTNGGQAVASPTLVPLRGGCGGGIAGTGPTPGAGGGAIEISASGTIAIGATGAAAINVAGGGAPAFATNGGNGGGSGGGILLVAPALATLGGSGGLFANGGAGSSGDAASSGGGTNLSGNNGTPTTTRALDTSGTAGGSGNDDGRAGGLAFKLGGTTTSVAGDTVNQTTNGRGGGGGGGGAIVITTGAATPECD